MHNRYHIRPLNLKHQLTVGHVHVLASTSEKHTDRQTLCTCTHCNRFVYHLPVLLSGSGSDGQESQVITSHHLWEFFLDYQISVVLEGGGAIYKRDWSPLIFLGGGSAPPKFNIAPSQTSSQIAHLRAKFHRGVLPDPPRTV